SLILAPVGGPITAGAIKLGAVGLRAAAPALRTTKTITTTTTKAAKTGARACSFTGATFVLMADGSKKPIQDIEVADKVVATDPETGEQAAKEVTRVFVHDDTVVDLVVDGEVISTTEDHPFWSATDQRFERADELVAGEEVLAADCRVVAVSGLELGTVRMALAYNLSVDGIHTYHVGNAQVLVHNTCSLPNAADAAGVGESRTYIDLTKGGSIRNVGTDAMHTEFADTLRNSGWTSRVSKDGAVQIFERDGARYVLREKAGSYSGWSADFTPAGSSDVTLKIRLGYQP
ncbi:MAG: polymorphic toxin-type HINT domain-containing protein, partial [Actinomycetales bacterium]